MNYLNRPVYGLNSLSTEYSMYGGYYKAPNPIPVPIILETKSGSSVANWKQKVENQQDASSYYFRQWAKLVQSGWLDIQAKQPGTKNWSRTWGYWGSLGPWSGSWIYDDAVTRDIALTKIKRKIASDKGDFAVMTNLLQDVYEFRKTITGTLDSLQNLGQNMLYLLGHRRRLGRAGLLRNLADLYLEWTFGINPTIKDAQELAESIQKYLDRKDHVKRFQASHYSDTNLSRVSRINPNYGVDLEVTEVFSRRYACKYISGQNMTLLAGNNYGLSDHFHLAPTDFIPTLWELLPWSWVWDYLFNIGDFLEDVFQSHVDYSFYDVQCINEVRSFKANIIVSPRPGWVITSKIVRPRIIDYGQFTRNPMAKLPGRMLRLRTEYELGQNTLKKLTNLMAVLATKTLR